MRDEYATTQKVQQQHKQRSGDALVDAWCIHISFNQTGWLCVLIAVHLHPTLIKINTPCKSLKQTKKGCEIPLGK
jgi:hypothetical protein